MLLLPINQEIQSKEKLGIIAYETPVRKQ
jgi:hypothetical protein